MLNAAQLRNSIISATNNIVRQKIPVNELNIFPVPDGDTGTNMSMTMQAAQKELLARDDFQTVTEVADLTASCLLRGARGNSGVILSLIFRGFSKGLKGLEEAGGLDLVTALEFGVEAAYQAVMKPTEGTILTVARVAAERGKIAVLESNDPLYVWDEICKGASEALEKTPDLLPVLKKAGVVDAGGMGLCIIFEGMKHTFKTGEIIEYIAGAEEGSEDAFRNAAAEFDDDITFTYCTEFIVGRENETDPNELRLFLETVGDCVVVVSDDEIIKVHVHTESPGHVLQKGLEFGQLLTVKIDNMKEQHRLAAEANEAVKAKKRKAKLVPVEPSEDYSLVAVAAGDGLESLFMDLGCTHVVTGGQTMNPSTADILTAIQASPGRTVFVLPNNKNIILAATETISLCDNRRVIVIPTKTIPQGIAALLAYDPDASAEENDEEMSGVLGNVSTGQVTFAARDSEFGGLKMKEGEIIALDNGKLSFVEKDPVKAVIRLTRGMSSKETSFITLIYGEGITSEQAEAAGDAICQKVSDNIELTVVYGGQPVYYFIVSVE